MFGSPLGLGIERLDTDGTFRRENANTFAGWMKYAFVRGNSGLQVELRRNSVERIGDVALVEPERVPSPGEGQRTDWVIRARSQRSVFAGELFYGRSLASDSLGLLPGAPTNPPTGIERRKEQSTQFGARAGITTALASAPELAFRVRDDERLPQVQFDANATTRLLPHVELGASVTYADWRDAGSALSYDVRAASGVFAGLSGFAEIAGRKERRAVLRYDRAMHLA